MSQHYSNAFTKKTMSSNTKSVLGAVSVAPFLPALPFSDCLQRKRERVRAGGSLNSSDQPVLETFPFHTARSLGTVVLVHSVTIEHLKIEKESLYKH